MGGTYAQCVAVGYCGRRGYRQMATQDRYGVIGTPAEWRDVPGYDGAYQISWYGQVRTWRWRGAHFRKEPKLLTPHKRKCKSGRNKSNRLYVKLTDANGRSKDVALIRLVVDTWLGGYPPGKVAYHKNGNTRDFSVGNIAFISNKELGKATGAKSRRMTVEKVTEDGTVVEVYSSARTAAKANHMSYQAVLDRCNGKVKKPFALDGHTYRFEK